MAQTLTPRPPAQPSPGKSPRPRPDDSELVFVRAMKSEQAARERLMKLRTRATRELLRVRASEAMAAAQTKRTLQANAVRKESDVLIGRDVTQRLVDVPKASGDELMRLSDLFNKRLDLHPDFRDAQTGRTFFFLFKQMDIDGSSRISFSEFERLVRKELKLGKELLPQAKLHGLWRALDHDCSGYIDTGEMGQFMKLAKPEAGPSTKLTVQAANASTRMLVRAETERRIGTDLNRLFAAVPLPSKEELAELSLLFNQSLAKQEHPDARHFFRLFKTMDADATGRVSYKELEVRPYGQST